MERVRASNNCSNVTDLRQLSLTIKVSTAALSLVACILAALLACICRVGRRFTHRISLYLLLAVAFKEVTHCLQYSMYDYQPNDLYLVSCAVLGALAQLSSWIMLLFTSVLVFHLACLTILIEIRSTILIGVTYRVLILTLSEQETEVTAKAKRQAWCLEISYILIPILVPMSFLWIPFIDDAYGMAGTFCWIRSKDDLCMNKNLAGLIEWYALWYIPLILSCIINMITIVAIVVILCKRLCIEKTSDKVYRNMLRENAPLLTYPVIYNFFSLLPLARHLYQTIATSEVSDKQVQSALWIMESVATPIRGLIFALAYCLFIVTERHYRKQHDTSVTQCGHERDPLIRSEFRVICSTLIN